MYPIKQSTALTVPFFVHDVSGDAVTGLTDGSFTKRISKNGAAFGVMTVTISEMENGWYSIPLSTTHSDTLGILSIVFTNAGAKQVNLQFRVTAKLIDDLNDVAATDIVSAGAITTSSGAVVTTTNLTTNNDKTGYALSAAGVDAIIDETLTSHVTVDSLGVAVKDILADTNELQSDDVPTLIAAVQADTDDIQTRLPAALVSGRMSSDVVAISGGTESADRLQRTTLAIVTGTCAAGGSTTSIIASALDPTSAVDDQFKGRIITFDKDTTTTALRGQATDITGYTHATLTCTVTALTTAPASGDTFTIT